MSVMHSCDEYSEPAVFKSITVIDDIQRMHKTQYFVKDVTTKSNSMICIT